MTKRILSVCLALVLLLGVLAGCSTNKTQTADDTQKTEQNGAEDKTSTQFAYQTQYFDLPEEIQWIGTSCVSGDTLYFTASVPDGGKETYTDENGEEISYDTYSDVIFRFDLDTGVPSPNSSSLTRTARCCAPSRLFPMKKRTTRTAGAILTLIPSSPTTRAMSIPMIIRPSTSTARTAASCSASPATS